MNRLNNRFVGYNRSYFRSRFVLVSMFVLRLLVLIIVLLFLVLLFLDVE